MYVTSVSTLKLGSNKSPSWIPSRSPSWSRVGVELDSELESELESELDFHTRLSYSYLKIDLIYTHFDKVIHPKNFEEGPWVHTF